MTPADAGGRRPRGAASAGAAALMAGAVACILSSLALAAWNAGEAFLMDGAYRSDPGRLWDLLATGFLVYILMTVVPAIVFSFARAWRKRASRWIDGVVSVSAGLTAFYVAAGILSPARGWSGRGAGAHLVDMAFVAVIAFAVSGMTTRLAESVVRHPRRAGLLGAFLTLAGAAPLSLIFWEIARDMLGGGRGIFVKILTGCVALAAAVACPWGIRLALRAASGSARRMGSSDPQGRRRAARMAAGALIIVIAAAGGFFLIGRGGARVPSTDEPNVLVLVVDTLRADHVGCYGAAQTRTPNIDALASRGVRVENMYATSSWTAPTTASLLTGLYPDAHGLISYRDRIHEGTISVAELFHEAGYDTAGFSANPILTARYGFGGGFDTWEEDLHPGILKHHRRSPVHGTLRRLGLLASWDRFPRADRVMARALDWLDRPSKRPFFLYLQFMDAHDPYDPPPPYDSMYGGGPFRMKIGTISDIMAARQSVDRDELRQMMNLYDGAISYVDDVIGKLLAEISRRGLLENTLVVFTADHGEEFLEHGDLEHTRTIYDEIVRVPLIVAGKGVEGGRVLPGPVRQVDVAPTLLQAAGIPPAAEVDGRSIWDALSSGEPLAPRQAFMSTVYLGYRSPWHALRGVRDGSLKAIATSLSPIWEDPRMWELYDLPPDPREKHDLAAERGSDLSRLRDVLEAWTRRPTARGHMPSETDEETQRRLRALGYVD